MNVSGLRSRVLEGTSTAGFANRLASIRAIRGRATAKSTCLERFAQIFFWAQSGVSDADFLRREHCRKCCQEGVQIIADQDLRIAEVSISRAFLEFRKCCSLDATAADYARNIVSARAERRRAECARGDAPYTFP
jgi:hypothetical protein